MGTERRGEMEHWGGERKKEREFALVESGRLQERSWRFEERQHCHLIFGLKSSTGQVRKEKDE